VSFARIETVADVDGADTLMLMLHSSIERKTFAAFHRCHYRPHEPPICDTPSLSHRNVMPGLHERTRALRKQIIQETGT
jgi:hypothetical protein